MAIFCLHDDELTVNSDTGELFVTCVKCGRESIGIKVGAKKYKVKYKGDLKRHELIPELRAIWTTYQLMETRKPVDRVIPRRRLLLVNTLGSVKKTTEATDRRIWWSSRKAGTATAP
jgi:hypothetical protein